jgi:peptide/nickel transport system substrate-binding protein
VAWPQPHKYNTDIAKAKALLAEAGYPNGFETTLSFDLGFAGVNEPLCILVQESLGQIGIKTTINKIPGANWRTELNKKVLPLYTNVFSGWLDYPEDHELSVEGDGWLYRRCRDRGSNRRQGELR